MPHPDHPNLQVLEHPLIQDKLARIREIGTPPGFFRSLVAEVAGLMVFQVSRDLPLRRETVRTPLEETDVYRLASPITIVPILRAGIGLADGVSALMPEARVGHIGLYRNEETLEPVNYYCKLPEDVSAGPVFMVDPMLATGGSAVAAAKLLRDKGCKDVRMVCLVSNDQVQLQAAEQLGTFTDLASVWPVVCKVLAYEQDESPRLLELTWVHRLLEQSVLPEEHGPSFFRPPQDTGDGVGKRAFSQEPPAPMRQSLSCQDGLGREPHNLVDGLATE